MFDFGFSELLVIGAVALVVLGPERLPTVARTAGEWVGKAQRFVNQIKADIQKEGELADLKKIQDEAKALASDMRDAVKTATQGINEDVKAIQSSVSASETDIKASFAKLEQGKTEAPDEVVASKQVTTINAEPVDEQALIDQNFFGTQPTGPGASSMPVEHNALSPGLANRPVNDSVVYDEYADETISATSTPDPMSPGLANRPVNDSVVYDEYADETVSATTPDPMSPGLANRPVNDSVVYDEYADEAASMADAAKKDPFAGMQPVPSTIAMTNDEMLAASVWGTAQSKPEVSQLVSDKPMMPAKTFTKRYKRGPSVEELAREIELMRRELGLRSEGVRVHHARPLVRTRTNRPRIYR